LCLLDRAKLSGMLVANKKPKGDEETSLWFDTCKMQLMSEKKHIFPGMLQNDMMFYERNL